MSLCTQRCYGRHTVSRKSVNHQRFIDFIAYRLLYDRSVSLGHIGTGEAISARGPIWLPSANMT